MTTRGNWQWAAPLAIVCLAVPIAGCAHGSKGAASKASPAPDAAGSSIGGSAPRSEAESPAAESQASRGQGQPAGAGGTTCRAARLRVEARPGGGSAGHPGLLLVLTNTGTQACTMYGYPGATFMTAENGQQINDPAQRSTAITPTTVTLAPGAAAQATLRWSNPDLYDEATCRPTQAAGVRVYPPDETTALFAPTQQRVCSTGPAGPPEILPIEPRS